MKLAWFLAFAALLLATAPAWPSGRVVDTEEQTFRVTGRARLVVSNKDGRTEIAAAEGSEIQVRAVKEVVPAVGEGEARRLADEVEVEMSQAGGRVTVAVHHPQRWSFGDWGLRPRVLVHLEITAPRSIDLEARSVDGPLRVEGFEGRLQLSAVDGSLSGRRCQGWISAKTVDGKLHLEEVEGEVEAETVDGDLALEGRFVGVDARTVDGPIEIRVAPGSEMKGDWSVRSSDGRMRIALPEDFSADVEVSAGERRFRSEYPVKLRGNDSETRFTGRIGAGGPRLRLKSSDGRITLEKL
jgi:hypothetical protein